MERVLTSKSTAAKKANQASGIRKTAEVNLASSPFEQILHLHKTIGNQAVQRLFKSGVTQTKHFGILDLKIPHGLFSTFCAPVGTNVIGVQNFALEKAGAASPPGSFGAGFTSPKISYSPTDLEVTTTKVKKDVTCKPKIVTPTLNTEARYISSGVHKVPGLDAEVPSESCGKKGTQITLPVYARVSKGMSELAKKGEEEHCDDFGYAFNQTVGQWAKEVNVLVGSGKTYGPKETEEECKRLIEKELNKTFKERLKDFAVLAPKTDIRDAKGYHSFELKQDAFSIEDKCSKVVLDVIKSSTNKIGSIPSKDIMK